MIHPDPALLAAIEKMRREEIRGEIARYRLIGQARREARAQSVRGATPWRRVLALWATLRGKPTLAAPLANLAAAGDSPDGQARILVTDTACGPPCRDHVLR